MSIKLNHEELVSEARQYLGQSGMSQGSFAKCSNVGESTFSRWLSGTLENTSSQDLAIYNFLVKERQRRSIKNSNQMPFVETSVSTRIWGVLDYSGLTKCMGVVYGDAGVGKTTAVKEWSKNRTDAIIIRADKVIGSRNKGLLKAFARVLRTQTYGQADDIYFSMMSKLRYEDKIIVIDEAQHLSLSNIELLRDIYDDSETPIVLIGNEKLYSKIASDKSKDYAQIYSRIGAKEHVLTDDTTKEDVKNICADVDEDGQEFLYSIAKSDGGLRSAVIIYVNASNNGDIGLQALEETANYSGKNG